MGAARATRHTIARRSRARWITGTSFRGRGDGLVVIAAALLRSIDGVLVEPHVVDAHVHGPLHRSGRAVLEREGLGEIVEDALGLGGVRRRAVADAERLVARGP